MAAIKGTALGLLLATLGGLISASATAESPAPAMPEAGSGGTMHGPWGPGSEACPAKSGEAHGGGWRSKLESLGLTPDQKAAIKTIMERYQPKGWELAQRGSGIREQLSAVSPDDAGYDDATEQAAAAASGIAADGVKMLSEIRAEIHAVLTPEQRQRLKEQAGTDAKRWDEWRARHRAAPK